MFNTGIGNSTAQKWGYQGQELSEDLGYDMQEYKFRHYDPSTGRFFVIDPLATDYVYNSTYAFQENKLGLGTELEGKELELLPWLIKDAAKNSNGTGAHALGVVQGVANGAEGIVNAIANPVQTGQALLDLSSPLPNMTKARFGQSIVNDYNAVTSGDGMERGEVLGRGLFDALLTKGVGKVIGKGSKLLKNPKGSATISFFEGTADNPFGHYSIETSFKGTTLSTEQVITSADLSTTMIAKTGFGRIPDKTGKISLPNANKAQAYQMSQLGKQTGPYNKSCNSCQTHVGNVLRVGGVDVPVKAFDQFKTIKRIIENQ